MTSPRRIRKEGLCVHRKWREKSDRRGDHADLKLTHGVMAVLPDTEQLQRPRQAGIPYNVCRMEPLEGVEAQSSVRLAVGGVHDSLERYSMNETLGDEGCRVLDTRETSFILVVVRDMKPRCG